MDFEDFGAKTTRKVRIGAIFACKVLLEAIFGPVQKWPSRAGSGWGLGLGARAGAGGSWFSLLYFKRNNFHKIHNFRQISDLFSQI